jgi:prophage tail gpP-like protein
VIAAVRVGNPPVGLEIAELSITRSLENAISGLRFATFEDRQDAIGERVQADYDDLISFTGTIENWSGTNETGFRSTARSTTVNLQLTDALANERPRDTTIGEIATSLGARVAVVVAPVDDDEAVDRYRLRRGTSYQRSIQELCAAHGYVLTDDADGRAVLYRAPRERVPLEVWELGAEPVRNVVLQPSIRDWRDQIVCRGQRSPTPDDVADVTLGQVGAEIVVGNTRPSRRVLQNQAARSKAAARRLVASEARKALARSLSASVTLTATARQPGDIVRVRRPRGPRAAFDQPMVIAEMTWTVATNELMINAVCVPIAVYDFTGEITASIAQGVAA